MKSNIEKIPVSIFERMAEESFDGLQKEEQNEVLKYFSESEYNSMHETHSNLTKSLQRTSASSTSKSEIMKEFDEVHQPRMPIVSLNVAMVWKVASVLLLFSTLYFALSSERTQNQQSSVIVQKVDTLIRKIPSIVYQTVRDTIYISSVLHSSNKAVLAHPKSVKATIEQIVNHSDSTIANRTNQKEGTDFQILTLNNMDNISNTSKRNSMIDDSLERNFRFVSL